MENLEIPHEVSSVVATAGTGWMKNYEAEAYMVYLKHEHISELERLVSWYTECLALYNTLGPGKQMTLDILNEAWELIDQATPVV
jgi:hypothetical protein